jgi:hypothetical protein
MQRLPRRRFLGFLRGLAGGALALPLLDSLTSGSARALPHPKRLIVFFSANGTIADAWRPTGGENDFVLSEILEPLAPHRDQLLILGGVDAESSYHGPGDNSHWNGMGHMLTGTELVDLGGGVFTGGGISVDQYLAKQIGGATKLASLELAVEESPSTVSSRLSYLGASQPVPPESDPQKVFHRLFGGLSPALQAQRKSVLDAVSDDLGALQPRLGKDDQHKLAAHLDAVRDVEKRLYISPAPTCGSIELGRFDVNDLPAIGKEQMDLLVLALACDLTRVVTLQWSQAVSMTRMIWLGIADPHHTLSHYPVTDAVAQSKLVQINRWYATQFAYLLQAMKAVPEGDGTLLDNSVVLWCNELGEGSTHSRRNVPYVLAGGAGGALKTGRYLQFPATKKPWHNDLLISLCQAMDVNVSTFGNPAYCHGPIPGLTG